MDNFGEYLLSLTIIAFLPAVMEETFFRGGIQNLLSRWFKHPIFAITITAILFSAIHGSYLGFLSRFALGFVLGWLFYLTGNIWYNIIGHFFNNAIAVTALYFYSRPGKPVDPTKIDDHFPWWIGVFGLALLILLIRRFGQMGNNAIDRPGEEVLIPTDKLGNTRFHIEGEKQLNEYQP